MMERITGMDGLDSANESPVMGALLLLLLLCLSPPVSAPLLAAPEESLDPLDFDDRPLSQEVRHPAWFKLSFLDLREDLRESVQAGKRGLIVYFGQKFCPYCRNLMEINFRQEDIVAYTRAHFDVVAIDIHGSGTVTDLAGREWDEGAFAEAQKANFTPTLVWYDSSGGEALRLRGYYPPYQFRAALEYVADGHYLVESFADYLERGTGVFSSDPDLLTEEPFFSSGPYMLDRSRSPGQTPLVVFFEQPRCHPCDVLHAGPLQDPAITARLRELEAVQLDRSAETPVITPAGERLTAREWSQRLGLFYTPTLLFFDEQGAEILRVDSVVQFYRLGNVLEYITSGAYRDFPDYRRWRDSGGDRPGG